VETHYTGDQNINTVIAMAERLESIHRSTGIYGKERDDKQPKEPTTRRQNSNQRRSSIMMATPPTRRNKESKEPVSPVVVKEIW